MKMKSSSIDYTDNKLKFNNLKVMRRCVTSYTKPFTFFRPTPIAFLIKKKHSFQQNVKWILRLNMKNPSK